MGLEIVVPVDEVSLDELVGTLAADGVSAMVVMIDGAFLAPGQTAPSGWRDARLRTAAGTVSVVRRGAGGGFGVLVFGNADDALRDVQAKIARALQARES